MDVSLFLFEFSVFSFDDFGRDANRRDASVADGLGVVLTAEYEDPDRDTSKQADACHEPPPTLNGAEDVLSAQDESSALDCRDISPNGARGYSPQNPLDAANWASLPN